MKKISVLILSSDKVYNRNVRMFFRNHYNDEIRIAFCESPENLIDFIRNNNVNIMLVDEMFSGSVPGEAASLCIIGNFKGTSGHSVNGNTFCKYISGTELYKNIIFLCSQGMDDFGQTANTSGVAINTFVSVNGNGATALSMAFAARAAMNGKKVLFIGLDGFTDYAPLFSVRADKGMSDIIYAVKSRNANVQMVAKSVVEKGENGVYFIERCRLCDDLSELNKDEAEDMFNKIIACDEYDLAVIDINFFLENLWGFAAAKSDRIYTVCENTETSLRKLNNFIDNISARDLRDNTGTTDRIVAIINKSKEKVPCAPLKCESIKNIPFYSASDYSELIRRMSQDNCWEE